MGQAAHKWLQLAIFCSPLAPGQTHLQLRVYFLNNTPCALQWAVANEQPHGGRLRGPCQLFDFTGARGDQCLKLKYISEGEGGEARAVGSPTGWRDQVLPLGQESQGSPLDSRRPLGFVHFPRSAAHLALATLPQDRVMPD